MTQDDAGSAPMLGSVANRQAILDSWIPVAERLPDDGVLVIGWRPGSPYAFPCEWNAARTGGGFDRPAGWSCHPDAIEPPTHWMPIPDGPHGIK